MKFRVLMFFCLILLFVLAMTPLTARAADDDDDDDDNDDETEGDEDEDEEEDPWGDWRIDHELNEGWSYPSDYIAQPLNYPRNYVQFDFNYQHKYARHFYDDEGTLVEGSFKTLKQTYNFEFAGGFSENFTVKVVFPFSHKKTKVFEGNQNYRLQRDNTYGSTLGESFVDFLDHHELWKLWEAELPILGDIRTAFVYSLYRKLDPRTTSLVLEADVKWPTGNDNPRRTATVRNYLTTGNTDLYVGPAFKQEAWKFAFEGHVGYNYRMPANTKYAAGQIDLADQVIGRGEIVFQIPELDPLWSTLNVGAHASYMMRIMDTTIEDNDGNKNDLNDGEGYMLIVGPKVVYQSSVTWLTRAFNDVYFQMDIPMGGESSFLAASSGNYLPPWELESYEGVGITYTIGVVKRWH